ncbi:hypothetical protein GCM10011345_32440 [Gemmobacter megaterium]|nr:hypothetical protein GCM10011345_32440 [Gemmobacter megaterium]
MDRWNVQEVYGLHNMPGLPVGEFAIRSGPILAAGDMFSITVTGKGGHAAKPHSAVDTTLVASHIVVGLQSIVSRNVDPLEQAVVTVAAIHSDSEAFNVIPQTVELRGTVRTFDSRVRDMIEDRIPVIANGIAHAFGAAAETFYDRGVPATVNAVEQTSYAAHAAEAVSGKVDRDTQPHLGGEDFSFMLQSRPGAFMFIGNGDTQMCHHPRYDFDDNAIPFGSSWFATLVEQRMPVA